MVEQMAASTADLRAVQMAALSVVPKARCWAVKKAGLTDGSKVENLAGRKAASMAAPTVASWAGTMADRLVASMAGSKARPWAERTAAQKVAMSVDHSAATRAAY